MFEHWIRLTLRQAGGGVTLFFFPPLPRPFFCRAALPLLKSESFFLCCLASLLCWCLQTDWNKKCASGDVGVNLRCCFLDTNAGKVNWRWIPFRVDKFHWPSGLRFKGGEKKNLLRMCDKC